MALLYIMAAGLVALAWLIEWSTWPLLASAPLAPFLAAVAFSARYGGLGPALLSIGISFLVLVLFLLAPDVRPFDSLRNDLVGLAAFLVVALAITSLTADRGRAEAALRRREEYLRVITDSIPALISHVDADLRYLFNNRAYEDWFGVKREEIHGRTIEEFLGPEAFRNLRPILETALGGEPIACERWMPYRNRGRYINVHYVPDIDPDGHVAGLFVLVNDISELKRAEERFRLAGEAVNGLFYDWDVASGRVERSAGLIPLLGFDPAEVGTAGEWWIDRIHPDDLERCLRVHAEMVRPNPPGVGPSLAECEYRLRHRDGSYRVVWDRSRVVRDSAGHLARVVGFVVDVTSRRRMEEALRDADRRKDEFLAMLAHELRNPLSSVSNAVRLLSSADTDPDRAHAARAILDRQVRHLSRLIDDLLDVSRITRGKIRLRRQAVDVPAVAERALDAVRPLLHARSQHLNFPPPSPDCWVDADPTRLEQILTNLLTNASKYSDDGARIELTISRLGPQIALSVRDNGIGIPADKLPQIFDLFAQVDPSMDRAHGGLGIGLTLVKTLVELHGGTVSARSDGPGLGSEFTVLLPATSSPSPPPAPRDPGPSTAPKATGTRVLIVDDNTDSSGGLSWLLQAHGYTVLTSADGLAALRVAPEFRPEIALLDIGLPGLNGYQLAPALRALPGLDGLIIIAVTGYGQESDRSHSRSAGFHDHLVKPVDLASLLATMSRHLASRTC